MFGAIRQIVLVLMVCCLQLSFSHAGDGNLTLPGLFLIGAAKSGTTTLNSVLTDHPEICDGTMKEMHFFDSNWEKGFSWYNRQYNGARNCIGNKYLLDSTPKYIRDNVVPERVRQSYHPKDLAKKKFLLVLRDPVSREFSWFGHQIAQCLPFMWKFIRDNQPKPIINNATGETVLGYAKEDICAGNHCQEVGCKDIPVSATKNVPQELYSFDEYAVHQADMVHHGSSYAKQIRNWLRVIKREQLFVVSSETFFSQPADTLHRIAQFLNLSSDWGKQVTLPLVNKGWNPGSYISCRMHDNLQAYFDPLNADLYNLLNHAPGKPPSEPIFPPFTSSRKICKDV